MIMLDTCSLIWHTVGPNDSLSVKAKQAINNASELLISAISFWEIGIKLKKEELLLPITLENFINRLKQAEHVKIIALDENVIMKSLSLDWAHKDPADRFIVATAARYGIPLVTADNVIRNFYPRAIW